MSIANAEKGRKIMPDGNQPDSQNAEGGTPAEGKKFYMRSTDVPPAEYDRRWNKAFDPNVKPQETSMGSDQTAQPVTEAEVLTPESKRPGPGVLEGTRTQARINGAEELKPQTREEFFKGKFNNDFPDIDRQKASSETTAKFEHLTPEQTKEKAWEDGRAERKRIDEVIANALKNPQKEEPSMRAEDTVPILEKINQEKKAAAAETKTKAYYGYMLEALDKNPIKTPSEASNQPKAYMDYMIKNANAGKGESGKPVDAAAKKVQPPVITPGIEIAKVTTSTPEKKTTTSASAQKAAEVTAPASEVKTDLSTATSVPEIPTYESMVLPIMNKAGDRVLVEVEKTTAPLPEGDLRAILDKKAAEEIEAIEKAKAGAPAPAEAGEATEQPGADNKIDLKSNPDLVKRLQEETSKRGKLTDAQRYIVVRDWLLDQTGFRMKTNVLGGEEPFLWKNKDGKEDYVRDASDNPIKFPLTFRTPQLTAEGVSTPHRELLKFLEGEFNKGKLPKNEAGTSAEPSSVPTEQEIKLKVKETGKLAKEQIKQAIDRAESYFASGKTEDAKAAEDLLIEYGFTPSEIKDYRTGYRAGASILGRKFRNLFGEAATPEAQPQSEKPGRLRAGDTVGVQRTDGTTEGGWIIDMFNPKTGDALVRKDIGGGRELRKRIPQEELYALNPAETKKSFAEKLRDVGGGISDRLKSFRETLKVKLKSHEEKGNEWLKQFQDNADRLEDEFRDNSTRIAKEVSGKVADAAVKLREKMGSGAMEALDISTRGAAVVGIGVLGAPAALEAGIAKVAGIVDTKREKLAASLEAEATPEDTQDGMNEGVYLSERAEELREVAQQHKAKIKKFRIFKRGIDALVKRLTGNR